MSSVSSILGRVDGRSRAPSSTRLSVVAVALGTATLPQQRGNRPFGQGRNDPKRKEPEPPLATEHGNAARSNDFPQFPGEEVYSHAAAMY